MMDAKGKLESLREAAEQSAFSKTVHSIRTRYSLATAFFIRMCLSVFYIGGRIVLIHLMREAEKQVEEIGYDISRLAYRHAETVRNKNSAVSEKIARSVMGGVSPLELLSGHDYPELTLILSFDKEGTFVSGAARGADESRAVTTMDVEPYAAKFSEWMRALGERRDGVSDVGIVQLCGRAHYVFAAPGQHVAHVIIGSAFDSAVFTSRVNDGFSGLDVRIVNRKVDIHVGMPSHHVHKSENVRGFGLEPILSEALNFYSGGFWNLGSSPYEAVFAVRDIAGNAVSMITVTLPGSFSTVTRSALGRLSFFIAVLGIVLIVPVFWFQGRLLLNPLTKMTEAIRTLGEHHQDVDCPFLEWEGKDEFALLALSVNRMLETILARSVKVAQVEASHRALIAGVPDALAVFDRRGRLVSVTKQPEGTDPIPGFVAGEPPRAEVFGTESARGFVHALGTVFESANVANVRLKVGEGQDAGEGGAEQQRYFEVRITRMDEVFALAIVRDVTREAAEHRLRLAAESRALDASKRESLSLFAAGIAHDVNNVLSIILNTVESAASAPDKGLKADVIRDAVKRGSNMTRELMAYAGDGKMSLMRASPDFFVLDVQALASHVVGPNVAISYSLGKGLPDVDADPNQFWKVLFNIVKNASEALGGRPGHITLSTEAFDMTEAVATEFTSESPLLPGPGVVFRISDDGPGIPQEVLPRLFDPYVSSKSLGRGLGLATVRTIVEAHGGGIKVMSRPDQGTTFLIFMPKSRLPKDGEDVGQAAKQESGALPQEVLVVDDDEAILKTLSILLKSLKVAAHVGRDRVSSLAVVRREARHLGAILMDAHLGGVDVVRLFDAFRIAAPEVPVVVMSGSTEEDIRKLFGKRKFDAFLAKPFMVSELKKILGSVRVS